MRRLLAVAAALAAAVAVVVSPAGAVKYGTVDSANAYPWVGLMVAVDDTGNPMWRCTGSLISEDTFLTAAHCVGYDPDSDATPASVRIWFDVGPIQTDPQYLANVAAGATNLCAGVTGYPCGGYDAVGTPLAHPEWTGSLTIPETHDVGLVTDLTWADPTAIPSTFGQVAPLGFLDDLAIEGGKGNVEFTVVGYGLQSVKPVESAVKERMIATVSLVNLNSALTGGSSLHTSNNPGQGHGGPGGTCFGDSGGPVIHDDPVLGEVIVGVNSFVLNENCNGSSFAYRVDTAVAQQFIAENG